MEAMQVLFWDTLKLALISAAAVYAVLIARAYATRGSQLGLEMHERDPLGSVANLVIWLGVKAVAGAVRVGKVLVGFLSEPSAEVGEWVISRSPRLQHALAQPRRRR